MKKSGTLNWFKKSIKNLLPRKGDTILAIVLKLIVICLIISVTITLFPIVLTIVVFLIVKDINFKNSTFKVTSLCFIVLLGIIFSCFYWDSSSSTEQSIDNAQNQTSEKINKETPNISELLNQITREVEEFDKNLIAASNYNIDLNEYQDSSDFKADEGSSIEEIESVLGAVTQCNDDLIEAINEAKNKRYKVVKVVDGDTIKIEYEGGEESVRLIGIDTPEVSDSVECFGEEASEKMKELVDGKSVNIMFDSSQGYKDKYGRLLLYIWVDKSFINKKMIADGYAYEYTYSTPYIYQTEFKSAQKSAQEDEKGLWGDVCACEKEEISRKCSSCKKATVTYQRWDCSTYMETVSDTSCTSGCTVSVPRVTTPSYTCDCSKTCTEIKTCAEAYYQLNTCGCSIRDNDKDGIPCENLCN